MKAKINLLETVPVRCSHVRTEWDGACAVLAYPRFRKAWMRRLFLPRGMNPDIRVKLEEHGTAVWQLIDGKHTVQEIITLLAGHFSGEQGYESRITAYVMQLRKDGFIALTVG
ncbi:MAG: PqqD family protein [Bacteroides sp.]|nr:PqqD family protein [Bacteroides sp.]